jgi:hypothetical protein
MNYNLDGLATDTCSAHHHVVDVHGSIEIGYGGPDGAEIMRLAQEHAIEISRQDLVLFASESSTDHGLRKKLRALQHCDPAFAMFIGYSFAKNEAGYDDHVSLETFIGRFRGVPLDVYVLEPRPFDLAEMLRQRLHSNRVYAFPIYWNLLAWAFAEVLSGRLDAACLDYFYQQLLDGHGPNITFPR